MGSEGIWRIRNGHIIYIVETRLTAGGNLSISPTPCLGIYWHVYIYSVCAQCSHPREYVTRINAAPIASRETLIIYMYSGVPRIRANVKNAFEMEL